jgi:hypothetical protein
LNLHKAHIHQRGMRESFAASATLLPSSGRYLHKSLTRNFCFEKSWNAQGGRDFRRRHAFYITTLFPAIV